MHQTHNIPWNLITSNFTFKKNDRRFTPPYSGLLSNENPNASNEIKHFIRKFIHTIRTFSDTERAKHPEPKYIISHLPTEGNLFSDELKKKYPSFLNDQNQRIEYWIWRTKAAFSGSAPGKNAEENYGWADGDLADVVKLLLYENEMSTLIMMARHPKIPIRSLHQLGCGHHFGFSRVMESALRAYMFFNSAEATDILANGEYTYSGCYESLLREVTSPMDHPAQQAAHRRFFRSCGLFDESGYFKDFSIHDPDWMRCVYAHKNLDLLHEYMKTLFALLYRYDLLLRECGIEPGWELEFAYVYPINKIIKTRWLAEGVVLE